MVLKDAYKYRTEWMGVAIIWIVIYHSSLNFNSTILNLVKSYGYGGVDIFLFASGLGCYCSYTRDKDILSFYSRRLKRIYPTYFSFLLLWIPYKIIVSGMPCRAILGNIFLVQGFTGLGYDFNWYLTALIIYYFLTPLLSETIDREKYKSCMLVILLCSIPFIGGEYGIRIMSRLPIYYLGMIWGKKEIANQRLSNKKLFFLMLLSCFGIVGLYMFNRCFPTLPWNYGMRWYPFLIITPGILLFLSVLFNIFEKDRLGKVIINGLNFFGTNSLILFLIHMPIFLDSYFNDLNKNFVFCCFCIFIVGSVIKLMVRELTIVYKKYEDIIK